MRSRPLVLLRATACDASQMDDKVNLAEKLALLDAPYQPGIVGNLNDYKLAVVKARGEFVWHTHDETDDFFLVLAGRLTIQLRDRDVELGPGELFVVPRGVEHCPKADEEAHVLLHPHPLGPAAAEALVRE
jgi:mannose-6-phosphate isomerase-like protein (cupin superfamily)